MKYKSYLDLSACEGKWGQLFVRYGLIPVIVGQHRADIDIDTSRMSNYEDMEAEIQKEYDSVGAIYDPKIPIGLYLKIIPKGAVLHLEI